MKKRSGGLWAGIIIIIACIAALFLTGGIASSVLRIIVRIASIGLMAVGLIMGLIVLLARKASQDTPSATTQISKPQLTQEQAKSLDSARSQLVNARMTISRLKDAELSRAGIETCNSIEKVLQTLKEKPEKIQTSRQLFNYYLPTLEKVVTKFQRIESGDAMDEQIPGKLKAYFGNVKEAMDNLYDSLYDNDKLHVEVDIEAMTMAIKRDGLLDEEDFEVKAREKAPAGSVGTSAGNTAAGSAGTSAGSNGTPAGEVKAVAAGGQEFSFSEGAGMAAAVQGEGVAAAAEEEAVQSK